MSSVEAGGHTVKLGPAGATVYDEALGQELRRKYKGSADVVVCEKGYVGLKEDGIHSYTFAGVDMSHIRPSKKKAGRWVRTSTGRQVYIPAKRARLTKDSK